MDEEEDQILENYAHCPNAYGLRSRLPWWNISYLADYITIVVLWIIVLIIVTSLPTHTAFQDTFSTNSEDVQSQFNKPAPPQTVSTELAFTIYAIVPPFVLILAQAWVQNLHDLHNGLLAFLTAGAFNELITEFSKRVFGLLRPLFLSVCEYDAATGLCTTTNTSFLTDTRQSFPSGHASNGFCAFGLLALYLAGKMKPFHRDSNGLVIRLVIIASGLVFALYVSATRVTDFRHFMRDVTTGAILGLVCAYLVTSFSHILCDPFDTNEAKEMHIV
eukprot:TRINITY_DN3330_c0_g1_i1.p1 TRINITY_DN3330_c0_g1~~TRINITY_DN3330_c0_g1_i1.p1  ORF type:complete len:275 (+),score=26.12 TRINITY_DN3330_c0_g1_i1:19-843(+)